MARNCRHVRSEGRCRSHPQSAQAPPSAPTAAAATAAAAEIRPLSLRQANASPYTVHSRGYLKMSRAGTAANEDPPPPCMGSSTAPHPAPMQKPRCVPRPASHSFQCARPATPTHRRAAVRAEVVAGRRLARRLGRLLLLLLLLLLALPAARLGTLAVCARTGPRAPLLLLRQRRRGGGRCGRHDECRGGGGGTAVLRDGNHAAGGEGAVVVVVVLVLQPPGRVQGQGTAVRRELACGWWGTVGVASERRRLANWRAPRHEGTARLHCHHLVCGAVHCHHLVCRAVRTADARTWYTLGSLTCRQRCTLGSCILQLQGALAHGPASLPPCTWAHAGHVHSSCRSHHS